MDSDVIPALVGLDMEGHLPQIEESRVRRIQNTYRLVPPTLACRRGCVQECLARIKNEGGRLVHVPRQGIQEAFWVTAGWRSSFHLLSPPIMSTMRCMPTLCQWKMCQDLLNLPGVTSGGEGASLSFFSPHHRSWTDFLY